jgi:hemolysin activation/secretion protein
VRRELKLGAAFDVRYNRTSLLGRPFSFSAGAEEGETRVSVLRLIQEYGDRSLAQVFAARSTLSMGVYAFDATSHDNLPDSRFVSWIGQAKYARRAGTRGAQWILRGDVQLSSEELLPLERIAIGGAATVRGYRENQLVRDQGYALSVELRYPMWGQPINTGIAGVDIAAFVDSGAAWNKGQRDSAKYLHSLGIGLLGQWQRISADIYVAHALEEVPDPPEYDLQDDGVHFRVTAQVF